MSVPQSERRSSESHLEQIWPTLLDQNHVAGIEQLDIIGMNAEMTVSTLPENLWTQGVVYPWPTVADQCKIQSDNVADDAGSTGATDVKIEGLDSNGDYITEDIELDGTTPVATVLSYLRINLMLVIAVGTGGDNAGLITMTHDTGDPVIASIMAGHGVSMDGVFTVRSAHTLAISRFTVDMIKAAAGIEASIAIYVRSSGTGPWIRRATLPVLSVGTSDAEILFPNGLLLPAGCDMKMEVVHADDNGIRIVARAHALLVDDDVL